MFRASFIFFFLFTCLVVSGQTPLPGDSLVKLLVRNPQKDTNRVLILNQLAYSHYYNNPIQSFQEAFEARNIADSLNFSRGEAEAFRQIGMSFWAQADMPTAINYFLIGLKVAETNNHKQVEADILSNIGTAYNGLNNPQEALKFLTKSRDMQRQLNNLWREAAVLNNMGDSYKALKEFNKASEAYTFALDIARKNNYSLGITTNLRNLGNIFELTQQYDSALSNYFKCIELSAAIKDARGVILSNKSVASVYLVTKKLSLAKKYANVALKEAVNLRLKVFIRDSYDIMYQISEAEGNRNSAFEYFKLYTLYKDSVQDIRIISEIAADRLRYETDKKQTEIELLKRESEFQGARIRYQNTQILIISVSLAVCIVFILVAFVNYRRMQVKNRLLSKSQGEVEEKNKLLSQKGNELNLLNEELLSRQAQVVAQRDELATKNQEVENMHKRVIEVNQNLEKLVSVRTKVLMDQNQRLTDYSFFNAHQLRSPVASIMGLVNLLQHSSTPQEHLELLNHLEVSAKRLDEAIRSINDTLQEGIHPTEKE